MILVLPRADSGDLLASTVVPWRAGLTPNAQWHPRALAETDATWLQVIPYAVLVNGQGQPWAYRRTGGDARLRERRSIGVGGHVEQEDDRGDFLTTIQASLTRELEEELHQTPLGQPVYPIAWINEQDSAIGRVHVGVVFVLEWTRNDPPRARADEGLASLGFVDPATVTAERGFEIWSVLALRALAACR